MAEPAVPAASHGRGLHLASLLAARLCHDLASGLGTVRNCLQLARDEEHPDGETLALAAEAANGAVDRLRLLRAAWGGNDEALSRDELLKLAAALGQRRLELRLSGFSPAASFSSGAATLALNLLILAAECLPVGGDVTMEGDDEGGFVLAISGRLAAWPAGFAAWLASADAAWGELAASPERAMPRSLQGVLTALIAHDRGVQVSMLMAAGTEAAPPLLVRFAGTDRGVIPG